MIYKYPLILPKIFVYFRTYIFKDLRFFLMLIPFIHLFELLKNQDD